MSRSIRDKQGKAARTKARILDAAREALREQGVCGVTIHAIARRAAVAVGTVYAHFAGKRELLDALGLEDADPAELRARQRLEQVLDAALAVFLERGYVESTMEEIAERAGVSKAALYEHVSSKEELFARALRRGIDAGEVGAFPLDERGGWIGPGRAPRTPEALLTAMGRWFLSRDNDDMRTAFTRIVLTETARSPEFARLHFELVVLETNNRLTRALMRLGCGPEPELHDTARAFMGQLFSWILVNRLLVRQAGSPDVPWSTDPDVAISRVVRTFVHGDPVLRPRRASTRSPA